MRRELTPSGSKPRTREKELGAMPFGGRPDQVFVDERLAKRDSVIVEAGSHERSVRLRTADQCASRARR